MTKALFAASLITFFWLAGSIGLIAMASASSRSSACRMSPFCSSIAPVFVVLKTTVTSGSSASAFSHPLRAIFQKSEVVLVIKATVFTAFGAFGGEAQLTDRVKKKASKQTNLRWINLFMAGTSCEKSFYLTRSIDLRSPGPSVTRKAFAENLLIELLPLRNQKH